MKGKATKVSAQGISVTLEHEQGTIALRGEHEAYTADKLARQLAALIDEGVAVTVDLTEASFIDSTIVGVLLAAQRRAEERRLRFQLHLGEETGWAVRRILEVTGLGQRFEVVD